MKKVIGLVLGLLPVSAFGECVPVPDCASIGYTETSCDGDSLKCPFDTTKLKCIPCDSSFRYSCSGENITSAVGDACNNKYVTCNCVAGATFNNGECICDTSCNTIGNIYYSDGTCSSCNLTDKTPVGIVAYKDENRHLIVALEQLWMTWATDITDDDGNIIIPWNTDLENLPNYTTDETALADFNGFENTQIIVETFGENATGVAAVYCYNHAPTGLESSKGQWYLPAMGELYAYHFNRDLIDTGLQKLGYNKIYREFHITSTEVRAAHIRRVEFRNLGGICTAAKNNSQVVRCVLSL